MMYAIDVPTVRWSEEQLNPRQPWTEMVTPLAFTTLSSSAGWVTLEAIIAQLVHMDAHLDTLSDELCQVNTHVGRITRRQVVMGGFTVASSPSPPASEDESDDGFSSNDADEDDGASSPSDNEMSTWRTYPLSLMTKRESSFDMRVVIDKGRVSIEDFCDRRSVYEGCSEDFLYLFFSFHFRYIILVDWSCEHLVIANIVLIFLKYIWWCCYHISPISLCVVSFLSLYTYFLFNVCNLIYLFHTKIPWWVLFKVF